ncbi:unnamed protein product [Rotaria sp. Silwood1]|nr:unnamed protein product [Rotaria sp. Silwood1]CAF1591250.1 unnamed protein product [Rotaria sp. Silwood1]CAF3654620.1 unnamed protein product [Rotaria sp. Silwood1]CAF3727619.1 unnamed protein product [Rotaria sp. Silwood1]CAF4690051.1 unnamed protein product [Rotaria sp. Silwood1]
MIRTISDLTIFVFGLMAIIVGLLGLMNPETILSQMNFIVLDRSTRQNGDYTIAFLLCSSMASLNMGIYYLLAAWNQWTKFYQFTVVFRLLTVTMFSLAIKNGHAPEGFISVVIWELLGALITGTALWYDANTRVNKVNRTS